ncbi:MAG: TIGR03936 family radical SAM-associated protein [Oscillospiraceae bacterium]|jgi:radical SAM-linked protein|nr:TIGR03936 family radical SAM-associated protein [Oscillospiraceae bacterium]
MLKYRLIFEKTDSAVFVSHLDTMRTLQRVFRRADIPVKYSQGFNPHPIMSIVLPLSVGQSSICEVLDFESESALNLKELPPRLTPFCPRGIRITDARLALGKPAAIKWVEVTGTLYGLTQSSDIAAICASDAAVTKKTKKGELNLTLSECVRQPELSANADGTHTLRLFISAQEPSFNPELLGQVLGYGRAEYTRLSLRTEVFDIWL